MLTTTYHQVAKGAKLSHDTVVAHKTVTDIWADLDLQEMPDSYDTDSHGAEGSQLSDAEGDEPVWSPPLFSPVHTRDGTH